MSKNLLVGLVWLIITITTGCNPIKRANRKIDKAVNLTSPDHVVGYVMSKYRLKNLEIDTVIVVQDSIRADTFIVLKSEIHNDTVVKPDTIIINRDRLKIQVIKQRDTIKISGICTTDTVYRYKTIYVEKVTENQRKSILNRRIIMIAAFILLAFLIVYFVNRFIKTNF